MRRHPDAHTPTHVHTHAPHMPAIGRSEGGIDKREGPGERGGERGREVAWALEPIESTNTHLEKIHKELLII